MLAGSAAACRSRDAGGGGELDGSLSEAGVFHGDDAGPSSCTGADCATTLTGTVYDPAGTRPIAGAVVFVPMHAALPPIPLGTHACDPCDVSVGDYAAAATTDVQGKFTLYGAPAGASVPFVVQVGKWRRESFLNVAAGVANAVPAASSRLPRNHTEGDMPASRS